MSVSLEDVLKRTLSSLEDAVKSDNVKLCKTLVETHREILQEENLRIDRRVAVERGMIESLVMIIKHFSVKGNERDSLARLGLVQLCLDILVDLKPFVRLDNIEQVPISVLLRSFGVGVIVRSMNMHWDLKNRPLTVVQLALELLLNVAASEQGTRMLVDCQLHIILLKNLDSRQNIERPLLSLVFEVLVSMTIFQSSARDLFTAEVGTMQPLIESSDDKLSSSILSDPDTAPSSPSFLSETESLKKVDTVLRVATTISITEENFTFHKHVACFLCMVSTKPDGASLILSREGFLGYISGLLSASSRVSIESSQEEIETNRLAAAQLQEQYNHGYLPGNELTDKSNIDGGLNVSASSDGSSAVPSSSEQSLSIDTINTHARNAVSAGSQLINNWIRRPSLAGASKTQQNVQNKPSPTNSLGERGREAGRVACWCSMLFNNLCIAARKDVQMRMVIASAYKFSNFALEAVTNRSIFQRVLQSTEQICNFESSLQTSNSSEEDLLVFDESLDRLDAQSQEAKMPLIDMLVNDIISAPNADSLESRNGDDFIGRSVLFCLDYIEEKFKPKLHMEALLQALLQKFTSLLTDATNGLPAVLPISTEGSRILSFVFLALSHPFLQKRIARDPGALEVIVGPPKNSLSDKLSFLSLILGMDIPEYSNKMERSFHSLVDSKTNRLKIFPMLPYRSFNVADFGILASSSTNIPLQRQSSLEPSSASPLGNTVIGVTSPTGGVPGSSSIAIGDESSTAGVRRNSFSGSPLVMRSKSTVSSKSSSGGANGLTTGQSMLQVDTTSSAAVSNIKRSARASSIGISPRLGLRSSTTKDMRRASTPYVPSHSHVVLSPLLNDLSTRSLDQNDSMNGEAGDDSAGEGVGDLSSDLLSSFSSDSKRLSIVDMISEPANLAIQMSLRMERVYMVIDPAKVVLLAFLEPVQARSLCAAELRFLHEYDKLVFFFKKEVLHGSTPLIRAKIVQCIIDIAFYAACPLLRNASLVMACLEALDSSPVRRLELTWRNVDQGKWQRYEAIKKLCGFTGESNLSLGLEPPPLSPIHSVGREPREFGKTQLDMSTDADFLDDVSVLLRSAPAVGEVPTVLLGGARIPYLQGLLVALRRTRVAGFISSPSKSREKVDNGARAASPKIGRSPDMSPDRTKNTTANESAEEDLLQFDDDDRSSSPTFAFAPATPDPLVRSTSGEFDPLGLFNSNDSLKLDTIEGNSSSAELIGGSGVHDGDFYCTKLQLLHIHAYYEVLSRWITTVRSNGDWFQKVYAHQPAVQLQILLKGVEPRNRIEESKMAQVSLRQEPAWSLEQMLLESLYAIEGWIESLFESETEEEGKVIRAFRQRVRKQNPSTSTIASGTSNTSSGTALDGSSGGPTPVPLGSASNLSSGLLNTQQAATRFRSFGESAAAQIFRTVNTSGSTDAGNSGGSSGTSMLGKSSGSGAPALESLPMVPAAAAGKLVTSLVKKISVARRERLLAESGSRSAEHWDKIVDHVRLCVERIVLAPIWSRLLLGAMRQNIKEECALQERLLMLRSISHERLICVLELPTRNSLDECMWQGAIATLHSLDDVDMPSQKLNILLRMKDEIYREAAARGVVDMNADEFLPVMTFVLVRTPLLHAYSTTVLLRELLSEDFASGEAAYYLTTLEIALGHLLHMDLPQDILDPFRDT